MAPLGIPVEFLLFALTLIVCTVYLRMIIRRQALDR